MFYIQKEVKSLKPPTGQIISTLFDGGYLIKVSKATATRNLSEFIEKHKLSDRTGVVGAGTIYVLIEL